jgi:SAM-dependent methyltransferase
LESFIYDLRWRHDDTEWRSEARRQAVMAMWDRFGRSARREARVLDIGCGTGAGLEKFGRFGKATGIDMSETAVRYSRLRNTTQTAVADAAQLPFKADAFDLVAMIEVLEHVDDIAALDEIVRIMTPGGLIVITVPAFRWLWSVRDIRLQHRRRYTRAELTGKVEKAGLSILWCTYIDAFLIGALAAMVGYSRLRRRADHLEVYALTPPGPLNRLLLRVCSVERFLYSRLPLPFGVSLLCVARKAVES